MKLVKESDPILTQETEPFDFENPPYDPVDLEADMIDFMIDHRGVGLSANQIGLPYRVFVFGDPNDSETCSAMFNPRIVHLDGPTIIQEEGCLSFPGLHVKIYRRHVVRVRYQNYKGETDTKTYKGYTSRIVQHEIDHLDGITLMQRGKRFHLDKALKKRKIWLRRRR